MRKLFLALSILFIASAGYAQHTDVYVIDNFSKLLTSHYSPYLVPKNGALEARNVRANDRYGSLAKRGTMKLYGDFGDMDITSIHRFYKSDDTEYLLATGSDKIFLGNDTTGVPTTIRDQLSTGLRWTWVTYQDTAIGCNGTDRCQKYDGASTTTDNTDGARTANLLTADLGAPFAELNTGANLDASSWYQYKMMFTDGSTTWYSSALSNPILTGASVRDITLTDIPLGPSGTTTRYIYRTEGQASRSALSSATYKLVDSIADNSTTTFDDTVDDGSLTTAWDTSGKSNLTPPIVKYITIHKERLFGGHSSTYNSFIFWSYPYKPDIFSSSDYEYIRADDGDEITFVKELIGKLVVGKTNSITNFETQSSSDSYWQPYTFSFVGCPAPYSAAVCPKGIIYLGWDGIYIYNGENSQLISDVVTKEINDISQANFDEVAGIYFENEYHLAYASEESGESDNNRVLVFNMLRDAYSIDDKNINTFTIFNSGNDYGTLYSGSSISDGKIYAHTQSLSALIFRYKSELDAGTMDSIVISGTENDPEMEIGWGIYIDDSTLAGVTLDSLTFDSLTIDRDDTTGYWYSPATLIGANSYDKLYWNESLGATGNVTFSLRSASSESAVTDSSLAFSSEFGDASGSDVSDETANDYIQLRATLSTTDITQTPTLDLVNNYVIKLVFSKVGASAETSVNSIWRGGYVDLGAPTTPKRIWGVDVYYTGTSGTMTVGLKNERGDIDTSFDIDLSIDPDDDANDQYFGNAVNKIYKWIPPINSEDDPTPIGRMWQFSIEEGGSTTWNVYKMIIKFSKEEYYDD